MEHSHEGYKNRDVAAVAYVDAGKSLQGLSSKWRTRVSAYIFSDKNPIFFSESTQQPLNAKKSELGYRSG